MPIISVPRDAVIAQPRQDYPEETKPLQPDRLELWAAGMSLQNPVSGAIRYGIDPYRAPVDGYNPFTDDEIENLDPVPFALSRSPEETADIKRRMLRQQRDREMLQADTSWNGILASVAGGVGDPILWGPMLLAPQASVARIVAAETGAAVLSESILHRQQPQRTALESAINIGAAAFVSGVLGTAAKYLSREQHKALSEGVAADFQPAEAAPPGPIAADSAGAQRAGETTLEAETLVGGDAVTWATIGPLGRVLRATSVEARKVAQQLADVPFMLRKFREGKTVGPSVESRIGRFEATEGEALDTLQGLWRQYDQRVTGQARRFDEKQFFEAITYAARRGDKHAVPEIEAGASYLRKSVFDPTKYEAQVLKLLPEDRPFLARMIQDIRAKGGDADYLLEAYAKAPDSLLPEGQTYAPRVYDYEALAKDLQGFKRLIVDSIQYGRPDAEMLTREEAEEIAESVIRNVFLKGGLEDRDLPKYIVPRAGVLQERTIQIPDALLERFLVNDSRVLVSRYLRQIGSDIELTKVFGDKKMSDAFRRVSDEYDRLISNAQGDEAKRLKVERSNVFRDLKAMRDRLTGQYDRPQDPGSALVKAGAWVRAWNTTTFLGGAVISNLTDLARPIMELGLRPYIKGLTQLVGNLEGFNLSRAELKRWGVGLDMTLGSRMAAMSDAADMMQGAQQKLLNVFGQVSLLNAWNAGMKQFTGVMTADEFLRLATVSRRTADQKAMLARAGLDELTLERIAGEFRKHGITDDGLRIANAAEWDDQEAAELLAAAVRAEVNHVIIAPGIGDKPLVASTEVGKLAFQFQSFIMSAQNRMLINGLQRHDAAFMTGVLVSVFIGMLVGWVKNAVNGKDQPKTPQAWVAEGVDRSGVLGLFSYPFNWSRTAMGDQPSRFAARNATGQFLGPTPGQVERVAKIGFDAAEGDFDPENAARLLPFQNLWHLRQIAERATED